jgi:CHASE3 domain sensor protein
LSQLETHINRINNKLQEVLKNYDALKKQHVQQVETIQVLTAEKKAHQQKIRLLEEQQYLLKSMAGKLDEKEKKSFEQALGKYIREIDKCIAMLSE